MEQGRSSLFDGTSAKAGLAAALRSSGRKARIIESIRKDGPATIWEMAGRLGLSVHQFAGRFGEMERDRVIEKTGERRKNPETACEAEVYRLAQKWKPGDEEPEARSQEPEGQSAAAPASDRSSTGSWLLAPGSYPSSLLIDNEPFTLAPIAAEETLPGVPYARGSAAGGGRRGRAGLPGGAGRVRGVRAAIEDGDRSGEENLPLWCAGVQPRVAVADRPGAGRGGAAGDGGQNRMTSGYKNSSLFLLALYRIADILSHVGWRWAGPKTKIPAAVGTRPGVGSDLLRRSRHVPVYFIRVRCCNRG
jgi:hypothetical protein